MLPAMKAAIEKLKHWAKAVKRDVVALWIGARDPRTPWYAKLTAGAVAAYALSPIDLIPDFIPVLGYLDDLVLIPIGIASVVRMIAPALMAEFRARAKERDLRPKSVVAATVIVIVWVLALGATALYWWTAP